MRPSDDTDETGHIKDEPTLIASPAQLLAGMRVGLPSLEVICSQCRTRLGEGETVSVYAYRPVDTTCWSLGRWCCRQCAPEGIIAPTLGTAECRVTARLGLLGDVATQQHRLCLTDPTVTAVASPAEGRPCTRD